MIPMREWLPDGTAVYHPGYGRGVVTGTTVLQRVECAYTRFGSRLTTVVVSELVPLRGGQ